MLTSYIRAFSDGAAAMVFLFNTACFLARPSKTSDFEPDAVFRVDRRRQESKRNGRLPGRQSFSPELHKPVSLL
jgi:hypothetical protein